MTAPRPGTTDAELSARFGPVFAKIAEGAAEREADRTLPFEQVEWLRESGFGRIRVPVENGGLGATLPQYFRQLVELARADSNLPQLLRGHAGFVETRLTHRDPDVRDRWLRRVAAGVLVGNAQSEQGNSSFWQNATTIRREGSGWLLSGRKFYSTGSLFADWIHTTATVDSANSATVLVPTSAQGVQRIDDWDGFGQRLTGSGTTIFEDVPIHLDDVEIHPNGDFSGSYLLAFFQLVHLATLAGIGKAAVDDAVAFVRQRGRNFANPAYPDPAQDPQVQQVVGRVQGRAFAAEATTIAAAERVEAAYQVQVAGGPGPGGTEPFDEADAATFAAQSVVIDTVLALVTELFEVGGSSAVTDRFRLDRHWRNARTLASHNPAIYRQTIVGDHLLNGTPPSAWISRSWDVVKARGQGVS
ncbi:acyl-CoA dehydrogenase [Nocardioides aromaticivorans]|uniref:Dibenzothiophene monooxygenase n=1 Tax=Nocardioides aromaticivorans TaxID=200618 RepID=A0ABX7PM98_9ACTN|nr:acyl-CoA dehydrogenase family protein [Nocardioides aromaticivorans]QSR27104.1 acyl-CoA dehydrogenase [Nocardioides aromaticivorans]